MRGSLQSAEGSISLPRNSCSTKPPRASRQRLPNALNYSPASHFSTSTSRSRLSRPNWSSGASSSCRRTRRIPYRCCGRSRHGFPPHLELQAHRQPFYRRPPPILLFRDGGSSSHHLAHLNNSLPMTTTTLKTNRSKATDSVTSEVRRVKAELLNRFNYDLAAMARDARTRQSQSGHKIVTK